MEQAKLLLRLFWKPGAALSAILDRGSLLFASLAVLAVSFLLARVGFAISFYMPLLVLALVYVPGVLLLSKPLARRCRYALIDRNARKGKQPSDHAPLFVDLDD